MKFRDTKTGEVFDDIEEALDVYVERTFDINNPTEAASLMGYEVIESEDESEDGVQICEEVKTKVKEDNMEKKDKPRLAEVLGVDVGERFMVSDSDGGWDGDVVFYINEYGKFISGINPGSSIALCCAIQHPERIIRAPRLTEAEMAICQAVGAKCVSYNEQDGTFFVDLWAKQPTKMPSGVFFDSSPDVRLASVHGSLFPSVKPGDCIEVEAQNAKVQ